LKAAVLLAKRAQRKPSRLAQKKQFPLKVHQPRNGRLSASAGFRLQIDKPALYCGHFRDRIWFACTEQANQTIGGSGPTSGDQTKF
jgi:hypothetical protein